VSVRAALQRTLGPWELICLGVGAIVGAGIFVVTGMVAALHAGPAVVLSFGLAALACLCAALCYAEFAAMMPVAGSAYSYTYAAFGRTTAWLVGWCLVLEYLMAASSVAVGWAGYLSGVLRDLNIALPDAMTSGPLAAARPGKLTAAAGVINLPAFLLVVALTALLLQGVKFSARMTAILVAVKLTTLALFIGVGLYFVRPSLWHPFLPSNTGEFGSFGWSGVLRGAALVFYAFLGFDTVSTAAREARNPQRNMPIGIVGSLAICTAVFVAFSAVLTGLAPYDTLNVPNPASFALAHIGAKLLPLQLIVETGVVIGLVAVVLVLLYGQSRVLYALAQDGLVPAVFGKVSGRTRGPSAAVLGSGAGAALLAASLPLEVLGELVSIGTLCAFSVVCAATLYLRIRQPRIERPFRVRVAPLVCIAGMLACAYLMAGLPARTWLNFLAWLAAGCAIYVAFGRARAGIAARAWSAPWALTDEGHRAMHERVEH
jgi:basic amino acid/polyamine antiporter, APA family